MNDRHAIMDWFPEQLSDEAAHAIYLFLEQFTLAFGECYFGEIHRYLEDARQDHQLELRLDQDPHEGDDVIPF